MPFAIARNLLPAAKSRGQIATSVCEKRIQRYFNEASRSLLETEPVHPDQSLTEFLFADEQDQFHIADGLEDMLDFDDHNTVLILEEEEEDVVSLPREKIRLFQRQAESAKLKYAVTASAEKGRAISENVLSKVRIQSLKKFGNIEFDLSPDELTDMNSRKTHRQRKRIPRLTPPIPEDYTKFCRSLKRSVTDEYGEKKFLDNVFECYMALPQPRPRYIKPLDLEKLLSVYKAGPKHRIETMVQYRRILDDLMLADMPISHREEFAKLSYIVMSGRYSRIEERTLSNGLEELRTLDERGVISKDPTPFNILMTAAIGSGESQILYKIIAEMKVRQVCPDRFTFINLITFYGKRRDKKTAMKVYSKFVESEEITDSTVLSALVACLVRCGDIAGAKSVLNFVETRADANNWRNESLSSKARSILTRNLKMIALNRRRMRDRKEKLPVPEDSIFVTPTIAIYQSFLSYYTANGDFHALCDIMDRMHHFGLPLQRAYLLMFKGFYMHGNMRYSEWTLDCLEAFLQTIFSSSPDAKLLSRTVSVWALRAYMVATEDISKLQMLREKLLERYVIEGGDPSNISQKVLNVVNEEAPKYFERVGRARFSGKGNAWRHTPYFSIFS